MTNVTDDPAHAAALAAELSSALKDLHRALLRAEMGDDPALNNPYTALFALIGDPRFAWMGALSQLIARLDQQVADGEIAEPGALADARADAAALLGEGGQADPTFRLRHLTALQNDADVGLATGRLRKALARLPAPPADR